MATPENNPPKSKHVVQYSHEDLRKALHEIRVKGRGIRETCRVYGIPRTTIQDRLSGKRRDAFEDRPAPGLGGGQTKNGEPIARSERYSVMADEDWRTRGGSIWNQDQERSVTRVKAGRCRATTCQLVQLVKFMEQHPQLAVSHSRPLPGSDELWMELADHINQFGPPKTYKQCKTTWRDLRKRAFAMHRARNKKGTGRNLYGMAPKIVSLITSAGGGVPRYKEKNEDEEGLNMSTRPKRKKLTLTLKMKSDIIQRIDQGENHSRLSREFGIGRSTIYDIYKNRDKIRKAARLPYKSERKTLRAAENPELEEKLYQWYLEERNLYAMTGALIILKARTIHKEMTGKDDFTASTGWLDRFKKRRGIVLGSYNRGNASSSKPAESPPPEPPVSVGEETGVIKVERTAGDQLVIRVTDKLDSKTNVFNRFTISDGHFENNITVKEEVEERFNQEEEREPAETEVEIESHEQSEEMFPPAEAILGDTDAVMEEKTFVLRDLNDTLRKFLSEYKTRNSLLRERIDLERARLQFDMEVHRDRQHEKRQETSKVNSATN